jgi:hypothetical protein
MAGMLHNGYLTSNAIYGVDQKCTNSATALAEIFGGHQPHSPSVPSTIALPKETENVPARNF